MKKSGLMGAGMGFMIGTQQSKDNYRIEEITHKASTIGATDGSVTLQALMSLVKQVSVSQRKIYY